MNKFLSILLFMLCLTGAQAHGATTRYALIVGNNHGGLGKLPLKYAQKDAQGMFDLLKEFGNFEPDNIVLLEGRDAITLNSTLEEMKEKIAKNKKDSLFLFYYSGHADNQNLRLEESIYNVGQLKQKLKTIPSDVKIAILDSCHSGEFTLDKGGQKAAPFEVMVEENLKVTGEVFITSSTAIEPSQESEVLSASYFTHFLTTGLKGAADTDQDNKISLQEAYQYAYNKTVNHSAQGVGPIQHPTFSYDLRGKGEVMLTDLNKKTSTLLFPESLKGDFYIYDPLMGNLVAEVNKDTPAPLKLAVAPGRYFLKQKQNNFILEKEIYLEPQSQLLLTMNGATQKAYSQGLLKRTLRYGYFTPSSGDGKPLLLQKGHLIKLRLLENLSSKTSFVGEKFHLEAATDVFLNDKKIISEGSQAIGEVIGAEEGARLIIVPNKKGRLNIAMRFVEGNDGRMIPLQSVYSKKGKGGKLQNAKFLRGSEFDAFVAEDVQVTAK